MAENVGKTKSTMATTKSTSLCKMVTQTLRTQRVVSTSAAKRQQVFISDVAPMACPLKGAIQTFDRIVMQHDFLEAPAQETTNSTSKPFENIPGPKGLPVIGTILDYFKKDGLRFNKMFEAYRQRAIEFGPIYKEKIGTLSTVVISDPKVYNKIVHSEGRYPKRKALEPWEHYRAKINIGQGLVNAQGEEWHKPRTVASKKMLRMKEVVQYCEEMDKVADDFTTHLSSLRNEKGEIIGIEKELFKWAMESIGTFLFEERMGCFNNPAPKEAQEFIENLQGFFKLMQPLMYNLPIYKVYETKMWKQFEKYADNVVRIGKTFVQKKVDQLQQNNFEEGEKVSFLNYMMNQQSLTPKEALSTAVDLLVGATETTSNGSSWVLYCLAKNPQVQEKLYEEIQRVLPNNEPITADKLSQLQYIKAILKETFRLYPITFATSRFIEEDLEVGGYELPSGTHVQANLYGMFRDSKYFPDPEEFKPERWLKENKMDSGVKALSQLVWGHGARMCIGRRFAEQEMHIMLTKVVQNFKLEYNHEDIEPVLNTVITPDRPLHISFIPRK